MNAPLIHVQHLHLHLPSPPVDPVDLGSLDLPKASNSSSASRPRFELSHDGSYVTDHKTGLMWPVYESENAMNADALETYIGAFRLGGFDDWFNPSAEQRQSITDLSRYAPALFPPLKSRSHGWEWTCTEVASLGKNDAGVPAALWQVYGNGGSLYSAYRGGKAFARPCRFVARAGQCQGGADAE